MMENLKYLNCPWCPAQSFKKNEQWVLISQSTGMTLAEYKCPANHSFYIEAEDTNFNYGFNKENSCE